MRTRRAISEVATRLFAEKGFEGVTVAEAAQVSLSTVFNYFPTKEDLFFDRQEEVENEWAGVVRERAAEEALARTLAEEADAEPDDLTPRIVAGLTAGVYRSLYAESRRRLLDGSQKKSGQSFK